MVAPVVTPSYSNAPYLLGDYDEMVIQWNTATSSWLLLFTVTDDHGEVTSFTETYAPVDYKITVYDICELLRPYFNLSDHPGLLGFATTGLRSLDNSRRVKLDLTIDSDSSIEGWDGVINIGESNGSTELSGRYFAYTNAPSGFFHSGTDTNGIGSCFLSRCDLLVVTSGQPCAVSWFGHGETLKVKLRHYVDGIPQETALTDVISANTNNMQTYNFTLEALAEAAQIDVNDVIYADVQLFLNSARQDSVRFMHETRHRPLERTFAFIGAMGEPEFMVLTGQEGREAEFEGVFLMEHNDYRKADTTLRLSHNSYTGALSEGERQLIWDMAASPWVYVIENGQLREVTITEVELTDSLPHREPIGYRVKWRYTAEREQRTFRRQPNTETFSNDDTIHGLE